MDALLNLEGSYRFGGIGGFVNISRHRDNLLINGLDAFSFGKRKILCGRITLGKRRLCCRLVGAWQRRSAIGVATFHGIGIRTMQITPTLSQNGALYFAHHETAKRRSALFRRFAAGARIQPPDIRRRTFADAHVSRRFHPDNGR